MRALILGLTVAFLAAGAAQARCPTAPDGASSNYVNNGTQRSICLQDELSNKTKQLEEQTRINSQLNTLQQQVQQQQFNQMMNKPKF
ncbi:MAG TPA: hypothetical protein VGM83_10285 [Devosiaceae bacterium]|jgi:TolA-binding protein